MRLSRIVLSSLLLVAAPAACADSTTSMPGSMPSAGSSPPRELTVPLAAASDSDVSGSVRLREQGDGVVVEVEVAGATPGLHGVHVHERADCSAPDATSAGDHWNPTGLPHGLPDAPQHHLGDLGNMRVGADGTGALSATIEGVSLREGDLGLVGRALIVHAQRDDGSQPSGDAGARVGCAEILDATAK